jgi:ribosome maturation factor RimP
VRKKKPRTVALTSNDMISAPGMLRWAMNGYRFQRDRNRMIKVMQAWPGLTRKEWQGVLSGTIPHTIEGEKVIIELGKEATDAK